MNEHDKQISGVEATANPAPSQGRRRLVKGIIISTPAILTLYHGTVRAEGSIPKKCTSFNAFHSITGDDQDAFNEDEDCFPPEE